MDFPILLGKRIKELRSITGLSQDQAAERAGISGKYLGQVERGEVNVSAIILHKLSFVFNVNISDFYNLSHLHSKNQLKSELIDIINNANEKDTRLLYRIVTSIFR